MNYELERVGAQCALGRGMPINLRHKKQIVFLRTRDRQVVFLHRLQQKTIKLQQKY